MVSSTTTNPSRTDHRKKSKKSGKQFKKQRNCKQYNHKSNAAKPNTCSCLFLKYRNSNHPPKHGCQKWTSEDKKCRPDVHFVRPSTSVYFYPKTRFYPRTGSYLPTQTGPTSPRTHSRVRVVGSIYAEASPVRTDT
jgi:hypothetical protein